MECPVFTPFITIFISSLLCLPLFVLYFISFVLCLPPIFISYVLCFPPSVLFLSPLYCVYPHPSYLPSSVLCLPPSVLFALLCTVFTPIRPVCPPLYCVYLPLSYFSISVLSLPQSDLFDLLCTVFTPIRPIFTITLVCLPPSVLFLPPLYCVYAHPSYFYLICTVCTPMHPIFISSVRCLPPSVLFLASLSIVTLPLYFLHFLLSVLAVHFTQTGTCNKCCGSGSGGLSIILLVPVWIRNQSMPIRIRPIRVGINSKQMIKLINYTVRPARMRSSIPLLEPGPPRFFWWYENSE
jgi:hypothetical protein